MYTCGHACMAGGTIHNHVRHDRDRDTAPPNKPNNSNSVTKWSFFCLIENI